jgi:uncharacterized membrane protein HdeD (DUF308 family)
MTASVSPAYAGAGPAKHTGVRIAAAVVGLATVVVGVVLLFNPVAAPSAGSPVPAGPRWCSAPS